MGYIKDIDRLVMVLVEGTDIIEGTDYDVLWGVNQPLAGAAFKVTSDAVTIDSSGAVSLDGSTFSASAMVVQLQLMDLVQLQLVRLLVKQVVMTSDTEVEVNGGALVDINASSVTIDGEVVVTGVAEDDFIVNTTGTTGAILLNSEAQIDLNAPLIDIHGDVLIEASKTLSVDKIKITSVDPTDAATITGQRTGIPFSGNLLVNPGFEFGTGADADSWTEGPNSGRDSSEKIL